MTASRKPTFAELGQRTQTPAPQSPSSTTQAPTSQTTTTPGAAGTALPEVQVIQEQPKPAAKQIKQASKPKTTPVAAPPPTVEETENVTPGPTEVKMSPIGGSEIPISKVPGAVGTVSASEIARTSSDYVGNAVQAYVPGVILSDVQGNVFQTNVDYRGFSSSPVDGVPQGLAVYQNGVRINESFGDTVNYDFLPTAAINGITVMSGNSVFGLNAIGGSISIDMKDGFNYQGFESDARFGSFGRAQGSIQDGMRFGNWATYIALEDIHDDGYRQFGTSDIRRMYADLGVKGIGSEFHLNFTGADNTVGVGAASPVQLLDQGWDKVFSTPQSTTNEMEMVSLNGKVKATDTLEFSGVTYYSNPNIPPTCTPGPSTLSQIRPVDISTINTYYGVYFGDTFDATDRLALTVGGRFNVANIEIHDETGLAPDLNSNSTYTHFNPVGGATYKLFDGISVYGSYSEGNRAPVPAELACANPAQPCLLPSFLTSDPPLKQVVSNTWEAGFRGENTDVLAHQKVTWSLGWFRTLNTDDILNATSSLIGRSSFENAGNTLRQGLEAQVDYWSGRLFAYAGYNFVDATFQSDVTLNSPNNPQNTTDPGNDYFISVHPGDRLPGVPVHKFKAGVDYGVTSRWRVGADLVAASNQIFFGDESNQNTPLGGYAKVNLHTSYDVTDHIQIYGLVDNLFDAHYGVYGTYFALQDASDASLGTITFIDPRAIVPAPPITAYGGLKVKF